MSDTIERDWVKEVGEPAYASIAEMVAALECDYDRLEELREEREPLAEAVTDAEAELGVLEEDEETPTADLDTVNETLSKAKESLSEWDADNAEELKELEEAAGDCEDEDDARRRLQEDALSVEVRSGWVSCGSEMEPEDFAILLTTGGPAVRIRGELGDDFEPHRAWLEVQDWGKPWTQYFPADQDTLLTYARCFCFATE